MSELQIGDTIACKDSVETIAVMKDLIKQGYKIEFVFDDPEHRFVLKVIGKGSPVTWRADEVSE